MAESKNGAEEIKRLEISKYPNRRYYDKTRSRHLTLEEIYAAIRDDYEVRVTDSKTGDDITPKVLALIILELDPPKLGVFPVPLLHRLLRTNEQIICDFTQKYFSQALDAFLDSQKKADQYMRQVLGLQAPGANMTDWARMMWGPLNPMLWGQRSIPSTEGQPPADEERTALQSEIEKLRAQVETLQHKATPAKKTPKRSK